jgi:hypothetical protein
MTRVIDAISANESTARESSIESSYSTKPGTNTTTPKERTQRCFGPGAEIDLVSQITAHLANELHRDIPVVVRIKTFWACAEALRSAVPHEHIKQAFLALAERSGLIADLGYHGREDVRHVLEWALRGRIPFVSPKPSPGRQEQ